MPEISKDRIFLFKGKDGFKEKQTSNEEINGWVQSLIVPEEAAQMQSVDYSDLVADAMDSSNQHMREAFTAIQRRETPLQQTNSSEDSDQRGQNTE